MTYLENRGFPTPAAEQRSYKNCIC